MTTYEQQHIKELLSELRISYENMFAIIAAIENFLDECMVTLDAKEKEQSAVIEELRERKPESYANDVHELHLNDMSAESKPAPVTTVTVWMGHSSPPYTSPYTKLSHSQEGLPNIDTIIADTLEKGALAIKVECTEDFMFNNIHCRFGIYLWNLMIGGIGKKGWRYKEYYAYFVGKLPIITDTDIEAAITAYLAKGKPDATPGAFKKEE